MIGYKEERVFALMGENNDLKESIRKKDIEIRRLKARLHGQERESNKQIAAILLDNATPEQVQLYERQGLSNLIGNDIWTDAKIMSGYHKRIRDRQLRHGTDGTPGQSPIRQDYTPREGPSHSK